MAESQSNNVLDNLQVAQCWKIHKASLKDNRETSHDGCKIEQLTCRKCQCIPLKIQHELDCCRIHAKVGG